MTKTDICNRALAILGHDRTITDYDNDSSTEALRCRQFYMAALEEVLTEHDWDFATNEIRLRFTSTDENGYSRLPLPADCVRFIAAMTPSGDPYPIRRTRNKLLVQNHGEDILLRYVSSDIEEESLPPKFREAFIYRLASLICGPMFGDVRKAESYTNLSKIKLGEAVTSETNETSYHGEWENPFLAARR